jgi:hypothetical protein
MSDVVVRGPVVPTDRRLLPALVAGSIWLAVVLLLVPVPAELRAAVAEHQATGEPVQFGPPLLRLLSSVPLLLLAHVLSVGAHGHVGRPHDWRPTREVWVQAPRVVTALRVLTWLAVGWLVLMQDGALAEVGLHPVFRS